MALPQQIAGSGDTVPWDVHNANVLGLGSAFHFAHDSDLDAALSVRITGGPITDSVTAIDTSVSCTDNTSNYIVVQLSNGTISGAISSTNWNSTSYARIGIAIYASGVLTYKDARRFAGGIFSSAGAGGSAYYAGGTDVAVSDGGTGVSALTAYAPIFGGTTTTSPVQSGTVGTAGQVLTSNGAGAIATFQDPGGVANQQYFVDGTPNSDDLWHGRAITGVNAGATIAQWEAVYMGSGGEWLLADANGSGTYPCRGLAVAAGTDNNPLTVITEGVIRNDGWNWTVGGQIYLSTTAGGLTQTVPTTTGDKVQQVGFAITADVIYLCIGAATFIEVTA